MVIYPSHVGPFDKGVAKLQSYNSEVASISEYIDKKNNTKIPQDPSEGSVRTKESFIYVPTTFINSPEIPNPERPGGVWYNNNSIVIDFAEEATLKHKNGLKFRLNGQTQTSLEGAVNQSMDNSQKISKELWKRNALENQIIIQHLPVSSMDKQRIFQKMFNEDVTKYQKILDSLNIKNIELQFYNRDIINNAGYCFADQALAYLDKKGQRFIINGASQSLHKDIKTMGIMGKSS